MIVPSETQRHKKTIGSFTHRPLNTFQTAEQTQFNVSLCHYNSQRHKQSTEAITYYLAKDRVPINAMHNRGLKKMINTLNKCYIIPSCNCFAKAVLSYAY